MSKIKETAENRKEARPQATEADAKYSGIAAHPLGREWLRRSLASAMRSAVRAGPGEERARHKKRAAEIRAQLEVRE